MPRYLVEYFARLIRSFPPTSKSMQAIAIRDIGTASEVWVTDGHGLARITVPIVGLGEWEVPAAALWAARKGSDLVDLAAIGHRYDPCDGGSTPAGTRGAREILSTARAAEIGNGWGTTYGSGALVRWLGVIEALTVDAVVEIREPGGVSWLGPVGPTEYLPGVLGVEVALVTRPVAATKGAA